MIKISYKKDNLIKEIKIEGHAFFAESGKDIVCAAVSTMATTTINNIISLDKDAINYEIDDAYILISNNDNEMASTLLETMIKMLEELQSNYPKNIKIGG